MEQINTLLNLPEYATASDRACAVYELMQENDNIQAARASAERELTSLREATSHIFAESICAARGITDTDAQEDIRAAWCADPYAALNALAGENITASNPYGCNQYGHEWRGKHGEGWKGVDRQRDKKKEETAEERTKRVVVNSIKDANSTLEELNKKLGKPPYDINDPRARAKVNLEYELTRTKERDTEEAAERLKQVTESAKKALSKENSGPPKDKNGAFKIPALDKALAVPTSAPGEKQAPIVKPSYMTDKQFKDALDGMDKDGKKSLSDALKKIAPRMDKNGQGLMPFAGNKNASSSVQNVMNKYNTLREKAENKINELQKIKSDSSKNWKEKNDAYEQWSDIYNSITALNNDFANFDKYDESRKKMAEKDMAYHIKRLEEDINR